METVVLLFVFSYLWPASRWSSLSLSSTGRQLSTLPLLKPLRRSLSSPLPFHPSRLSISLPVFSRLRGPQPAPASPDL